MKNAHHKLQSYTYWILDLLTIMLSYRMAFAFRYFNNMMPRLNMYICIITCLFVCTIYDFATGWNSDSFRRTTVNDFTEVIKCNFFIFIGFLMSLFVIHQLDAISRLATLYFLGLNIILMFLVRIIVKKATKHFYKGASTAKILILTDQNPEELEKKFYPGTSYEITGVLKADNGIFLGKLNEKEISLPVEELTKYLITEEVDHVFIYIKNHEVLDHEELIRSLEEMGIVCHYALDVPLTSGEVETFGDFPVITYAKNTPNYFLLLIKRLMDIIGGIVGLCLCVIISIFVIPAIKLDSPGPALFSQTRIGKNGRKFKLYKFRSMYIDAEERKKELMSRNEMNGLMFKMEDDPRVTKVGKFLRKTSLDEFPQFFNVIKGDMSLVGIRPPTEDEFLQYNEYYRRRLSMIPGITGLWQVSGRSDITDFEEVVKLDLEYIDNWSLKLDCKLLIQTIGVILSRKGAK